MSRRRHTPEQIITALREAEVGLANGKTVAMVSRESADVLPVEAGVRGDEGSSSTLQGAGERRTHGKASGGVV